MFILFLLFLFLIGLFDDLNIINSIFLRFLFQLLSSLILTIYLDIRIDNFYGIFGIDSLQYYQSLIFSNLVVVFILNSYNFIDGLDSLASSIGLFIFIIFSVIFYFNNLFVEFYISLTSFAILLAFLFYNRPPAKIFMGDSGSLLIGFIIAYCSLKACNLPIDTSGTINPVFVLCILAYPSVDTLRVFIVRILAGKSPFSADRNHIHHLLIDKNFTHGWASFFAVMYSRYFNRNMLLNS